MRFTRYFAAVAAVGLLTTPALAQSDTAPTSEAQMNEMAEKLADPGMQDGIATMVERMAVTMMKLPVGELAGAIEDARPGTVKDRIPKDATLADLAGDDARGIPEKLGKQSRVAMNMMSGFAKIFAKMMPELEDMARDMEADMKRLN